MPVSFIDHLTVTAPTLACGAAFVQRALGVLPQKGGEHPRMGTHNLLLRLGESVFLEVIASDPQALPPCRPRWFALDSLQPDSAPVLATWVARTNDIQAAVLASSESLGTIEPMQRGLLNWLMTIPADGGLPLGGVAPALIEWQADVHPATKLEDHGLSLAKLELFHPEPLRIERLLHSIGLAGVLAVSSAGHRAPFLLAHIKTPQGLKTL